jgi:hypothetical protein
VEGINLEPSCIEVGAPISKLEVSPPFERSDPSFLLSECWSCFSSYTLETALLKQIDSQKILKSGSFWTSTTFRTAEKLFSGKGSLDADSLSFLKDIKVIETRTFLLAKNALDALAKSPLSHCETVYLFIYFYLLCLHHPQSGSVHGKYFEGRQVVSSTR